ncbi:MAG TPA: hypothetical protein VEX68_08020 [Bryobacteraceae bacterium]|nr:hypothetical protein [Bryobacteraceae bacterium]
MKKYTPVLAVLVSVSLLSARQEQRSCASHADKWREELQLHQQAQAGLLKVKASLTAKSAVRLLPDQGNIAHLGDSDGVVARRNPYNLNVKTIRFLPSADTRSYRYEVGDLSYDADAAANGALVSGLGDDDSRQLQLPFAFPFFGSQNTSIYVNSDGNVTFGQGDVAVTDRSLARFLSGPPRIANLFMDLDPSRARGGIRVRNEPERVVISWAEVPEFRDAGNGPLQTFQLRLHRDGKIEMAFSDTRATDAVTGIAPGNLQGEPKLISFVNGPNPGESTSAIAERFSGSESVDIFAAAQKFYRNHEDSYDFLVIYNTMGIQADEGAVAYEVTVRNQRSGYGDVRTDVGAQAGSPKRLQAILNMGPLSQYPTDPSARVPGRLSVGDTPLSTIAHETGHLFLAYASIEDEIGNTPMLGHQSAHWDFKFNSDASLMEGNRIQDNGASASPRFLTTATVEGFSALDQYLMGIRAPEDVPDMFYVTNSRNLSATGLPKAGVAFDGERRNVSIGDVIAAAGRRTPDHTVAQRQFRLAFLLITPENETPTAEQLSKLDTFRAQFETYFLKVTSQAATADTTLRKGIHVSAFPAVGVIQGGSTPVTAAVEQAPEAPVTLLLKTQSSTVSAPASVVIPAGTKSVTFNISGRAEGVDRLTISPSNASYAPVDVRLQVLPSNKLSLIAISQSSPVRLRVTDINELPYPGVTVQARASGGSLNQPFAVSDGNGDVQFQWVQQSDEDQLVASVPSGRSLTIYAGVKPIFAPTSILNAASFAPGLVPGGIASIFGVRLGGENAEVLINGSTSDLLFGNDGQLNFVVPLDLPAGTAEVVIRSAGTASNIARVPVLPMQPGVFFDSTTSLGAITAAGTGQITSARPVAAGEYVEIYTTGLGAVRTLSSGLRETLIKPEVVIGGVQTEVAFSGLTPGYSGLYQINARIPVGVTSGLQTVAITANGVRSNEVKIRIR